MRTASFRKEVAANLHNVFAGNVIILLIQVKHHQMKPCRSKKSNFVGCDMNLVVSHFLRRAGGRVVFALVRRHNQKLSGKKG